MALFRRSSRSNTLYSCAIGVAMPSRVGTGAYSKITPKNELDTISTVDLARDRAEIRVFDIVSRFYIVILFKWCFTSIRIVLI